MNFKASVVIIALCVIGAVSGCSTVEASGEAVESVGRGVGEAGSAVGRGAGDIISGTGDAVESGARRTERKGY